MLCSVYLHEKRFSVNAVCWYMITGYYSFRGKYGTVFIGALCEMLREYHAKYDLLHILTRVNLKVARFESHVSRENPDHKILSRKKQMPTIVSMLTKDVYFVPKLPKDKRETLEWSRNIGEEKVKRWMYRQ